MRALHRINAAAVSMMVGALFFSEYVLERLGIATTVFSLLPETWRKAIMSEPYLLFAAIALFLLGIGLLWTVARSTAKAMGEYRASNERSHGNDALFVEMRDKYEALLARIDALVSEQRRSAEAFQRNNDKLDRLESERERTEESIRAANAEAMNQAAAAATNTAEEGIGEIKRLVEKGREEMSSMIADFEKKAHMRHDIIERQWKLLQEKFDEWRSEADREISDRLAHIEKKAGL